MNSEQLKRVTVKIFLNYINYSPAGTVYSLFIIHCSLFIFFPLAAYIFAFPKKQSLVCVNLVLHL